MLFTSPFMTGASGGWRVIWGMGSWNRPRDGGWWPPHTPPEPASLAWCRIRPRRDAALDWTQSAALSAHTAIERRKKLSARPE